MEAAGPPSQARNEPAAAAQPIWSRLENAAWAVALVVSISTWFVAIHAPLWLDETGSYWQISGGFSQIWARQFIAFPAYSYILWLSSRVLGTSEIALRIPSILAMLAATWVFYLATRELLDRRGSLVAVILFCLHPIVVFAAIDVRPYAFGVLATNTAIVTLLRLRRSNSNWLAALFGFSCACNVWFHYLFGAILPALLIAFVLLKINDRKAFWRQLGIALGVFFVSFLPVIPGLRYLFHTASAYVFEEPPSLWALISTFTPGWPWFLFGILMVMALTFTLLSHRTFPNAWRILPSLCLALIPTLILYGISRGTTIHTFIPRHRLEAVPGVALCWALALAFLRPRALRLLLSVALVTTVAFRAYTDPTARRHEYTWKYALQAAEEDAAPTHAPVVICSPFIETNIHANYSTITPENVKETNYFDPLSYYQLTVPVVPLPNAFNDDARRDAGAFLQQAMAKRQHFLAMSDPHGYATLDWLSKNAVSAYSVSNLGTFDSVKVFDFQPLP